MVEQIDVGGVGRDQAHVAIDSAVHVKPTRKRGDVRIGSVAHLHRQHIVAAEFDIRRHVEHERCIAPFVRADPRAVKVKVGVDVRAVKADEDPFAIQGRTRRHVLPIPTRPAVVVVSAVLAVQIVPGVGQ